MDGCIDHGQVGNDKGYGNTTHAGRTQKAHRAAFMREHSCSLLPGTHVLHSCDNPRCVNPDHLRMGTHAENMLDRNTKQRQAKGTANGTVKLTEEDVLDIRWLASEGVGMRQLGREYSVDHKTISAAVRRRTWKHL